MLTINNLQYELYDKGLFEPINVKLQPGECLQLSGMNGVGKSTVLKILAGLLKARRGSIIWQSNKLASLSKVSIYLGHELGLNPNLTVFENLSFYATLQNAAIVKINEACAYFRLEHHLHKPVSHLSAGLKRRCQLAKLLLTQKSIWLLDESFTSLDQDTTELLLNLFQRFLIANGIIIFTSHQAITIPNAISRSFQMVPHQ